MILNKSACVVGGSGFVASLLVKMLLQNGYAVHTTVRDPENKEKVSHLLPLQQLGDLKIFQADLTHQGSFDSAVTGCDIVFHVATPVHFASPDPENDMIKPAVQGVLNVLKSCANPNSSVKRVVLTSSAAAVSINRLSGTGLVLDEEDWTDVEFLTSDKPPIWGYAASKTLAEKAAWKFADENGIDLVTVIPSLLAGPSLTPDVPSSIHLATCFITGNVGLIEAMKSMEAVSGSISVSHVEDVCRAHIYVGEGEWASGRYICCAVNTSVSELAKFLHKRYPHLGIDTQFGGLPTKAKVILSSEKLMKEGFKFKYGLEEIYDDSILYLKAKGLLPS